MGKNQKIIRIIKIIGFILAGSLLVYILHFGMSSFSRSLHQIVSAAGVWGPFIFILFQIIQVIIPILPGGVSLTIGVVSFGTGWGFLYNYIGIVIGSIFSFLLVRKIGKPFIKALVSEKSYNKYIVRLENQKKFPLFFIAALLFPVAPDDLLCMLAGLTKMKVKTFILILLLCKPLSIYVYGTGLTKLLTTFIK